MDIEELRNRLAELTDRESAFVLNFLFGAYDYKDGDRDRFMLLLKSGMDALKN